MTNASTKTIGHFPAHLAATEARICNRLITAALAKDYLLRVRCGEAGDVFVKATRNRAAIQRETAATGATWYDIIAPTSGNETGQCIGSIWLIHGNGEDVISDMNWPRTQPENEAALDALCDAANSL